MRVYLPWFLILGSMLGLWSHGADGPISVPKLKADFDALYRGLQEAHFDLYVNMTKKEMDREFETRLANIREPMTEKEARIYFQRFVALGKIAHARIDLPIPSFMEYLEADGSVFPLDIKVKNHQFFITANDSGLPTIQEGHRIVAINGTPIIHWSRRLAAYLSADTQAMLHGFFEFQFPFLLWLELGQVPHFNVTIQDGERQPVVLKVPARNRAFMKTQQEKRKGRLALDGARSFRMEADLGYLRPGPFYNIEGADLWDVTPFQNFIDKAFAQFTKDSARGLIIDLRDNPGGDNSFSDYMLTYFAHKPFQFASRFDVKVSQQTTRSNAKRLSPGDTESISARYAQAFEQRKPGDIFAFNIEQTSPRKGQRFNQPVYILVNRHSYSNAVVVAAMVQDYGFGTIIGEETNDLATSYGAMEQFTLPNTNIAVGYPKAHIVRPGGDTTIRGVVPDLLVETPLLETEDDPVLQAVIEQVQRHLN